MGSFERIRALAIGKGNKRTVDKEIPSFLALLGTGLLGSKSSSRTAETCG
jgi:hypothetical protein